MSEPINLDQTIPELEERHASGVYSKRDLTIVRGEGALLFDDVGKAYIDCVGGQGAANLGHGHPEVAEAIAAQARTLISCPESFYNDKRAEFNSRLVALAPSGMERTFLCNSGTEAVEAALKFARYTTGRTKIVAAMRGFHGRTMGALSATWNKKYRDPFAPLVPDYEHVPYNNLERLQAAVDDQTAAVILEVVQGEGGVYPGAEEYLQGAQALCHEHGVMFVLDEVQTGFGRTGKMFALEHYGLQPDMLILAKSIGGGIPLGAVLLGERVGALAPGIHGSTFGGNPLSCAAGIAALQVLVEEDLPAKADVMGAYLVAEINKIESPIVREVRGLGLMIGIELREKSAPYLRLLMEHGVLVLSAGMTVIRLLPPLVITKDQVDTVVSALAEVLASNG